MTTTEAQDVPITLVVAAVTAATSVLIWSLSSYFSSRRETKNRKRDLFSKAFTACVAYGEFPYVVRRRDSGGGAEERLRISSSLSSVQQDLAYYEAWISSESRHVSDSYRSLVGQLRSTAGQAIHDAWLKPGAVGDDDMNIADVDLTPIRPLKVEYLNEVSDHLSLWPRWIRRLRR